MFLSLIFKKLEVFSSLSFGFHLKCFCFIQNFELQDECLNFWGLKTNTILIQKDEPSSKKISNTPLLFRMTSIQTVDAQNLFQLLLPSSHRTRILQNITIHYRVVYNEISSYLFQVTWVSVQYQNKYNLEDHLP